MMKKILGSRLVLFTALALGLVLGGKAQATTFISGIQVYSDIFQLFVPAQGPAQGVGTVAPGPSGTLALPAQLSGYRLGNPITWKYTDGAGNFNLRPYLTYVTGGHPACINLGAITGNQMPASPYGAPGVHATRESIYCGIAVGIEAGTHSPGNGVAALNGGSYRWCFDKANPSNNGVCTITDGGGSPLPGSQQPPKMNFTETGAGFGGTQALAGIWITGLRMSNPFTPAGGYFDGWFVLPLSWIGASTTSMFTGAFTHETFGVRTYVPVTEVGFAFTTGQVKGTGWYSNPTAGLAFTVVETVTGYDNRTSNYEVGRMQLVSGFIQATTTFGQYRVTNTLVKQTLHFVPEPMTTGLLAAGLLVLPVAYRIRNRRS